MASLSIVVIHFQDLLKQAKYTTLNQKCSHWQNILKSLSDNIFYKCPIALEIADTLTYFSSVEYESPFPTTPVATKSLAQ